MKRFGKLLTAALSAVAIWSFGSLWIGTQQQAFAVPATITGDPITAIADSDGSYLVSYYDVSTHFDPSAGGFGGAGSSGGTGDALLRIVDAGNFRLLTGDTAATPGDVCANIYVFNDIQEQQECCSCPITANELLTLSVINNLTSNPFNPKESLEAGVIKIVGSTIAGGCSNTIGAVTAANVTPALLAGGLHAWINHTETMASNQAGFTPPFGFITSTSVDEFSNAALDLGELTNLTSRCSAINQANKFGTNDIGICTCGPLSPPPTPTPTATATAATPTATPTQTTPTATPTQTTPTATPTQTTPTATPTQTTPTATPTQATPTATPTQTTPTATPTQTTPTATPTAVVVTAPVLCPPASATPASTPGSAGNYAVLAGQSVTADTSTINGNLGISPGAGLPPNYTGTPTVTGFIDDSNANALNGQAIKVAAEGSAFALLGSATIIPDELGGQILPAGVYTSAATTFKITSLNLTLDAGGDPNAVWIFLGESTGTSLNTGTSTKVVFKDGLGNPCNVFWQLKGTATLGVSSVFTGSIMAHISITVGTNATVNGRLLADTGSVSLDEVTVNGCVCAP